MLPAVYIFYAEAFQLVPEICFPEISYFLVVIHRLIIHVSAHLVKFMILMYNYSREIVLTGKELENDYCIYFA